MSPDAEKWCSYCRKSDHSDTECRCTRPAGWRPGQAVAARYAAPALEAEQFARQSADALAAAGWTVIIDMRRGPESCVIQRGAKSPTT